jgi:hypothetical protein
MRLFALCIVAFIQWCWVASVAAAPEWDPAPAIAAYTEAVNTHDLAAAVALFDQYGSATDIRGRHYEGDAGLTEFLLASGFGSPDVSIQTVGVHIVGNRAVWTYACSCQSSPTEVRMVMQRSKISVFAIMPPAAVPYRAATPGVPLWAVWMIVAGAIAIAGACVFQRHIPIARRRQAPGRLLTALARARGR